MPSELSGVRLAFAASGELKELDQSTITTVGNDTSLSALPCAIAPDLWAAFFDKPSRQREIRLFPAIAPTLRLIPQRAAYRFAYLSRLVGLHRATAKWLPLVQSWSLK